MINIRKTKQGLKKYFQNKDKMQEFIKDIAFQRIEKLFQYTFSLVKENPELSRKYILLARKVAMRARVHMPTKYKRIFCKKCNTPLIPGLNARVRIRQNRFSHITITCLSCGNVMRYPLKLKRRRILKKQSN